MCKYEYLVCRSHQLPCVYNNTSQLNNRLDDIGSKGWLLTQVITLPNDSGLVYYFMRPIIEPKDNVVSL